MNSAILDFANYSTLLVCMVLKFPQIFSVFKAGSAKGLSVKSLLLELTGFLVFLKYQMHYEYPPATYLEYPILIAQDVILMLCIFHYNGTLKKAPLYLGIFVVGWYLITFRKWIINVAMNMCTFISAASKLAQLQCLWQTKDSGQVSALTWGMAVYTCITRILTTLMTTGDFGVLVRFVVLTVLNSWVLATVLYYRKAGKKQV
ncbi:solute carrier family 66 member 3 [Protopterus annectens]|uniref:solute carrier family 66 member 3 n=1 Tax=Protopterus annectens TaxID=7888 RepID=UPI001CF9E585|nr:solute carrier family 66 member 3 [Protopterus annectens]